MPLLPRTRDTASQKAGACCDTSDKEGHEHLKMNIQEEGANVTGAALCALTELETTQMLRSLTSVIEGDQSLHLLSEAQLRVIFDKIDVSGNDSIDKQELQEALRLLGITCDMAMLANEMDQSHDGRVSFEDLTRWWAQEVTNASIVHVTSAEAWDRILMEPQQGFGQLIVLEVAFTFCRSCKAFWPKFKRLADEFKTVRFVQLVGNGTVGSMELCTKDLGVKKSPAFFIFRRGGEKLANWTGTNIQIFQDELNRCLELVGEPRLAKEPEVVPQTS